MPGITCFVADKSNFFASRERRSQKKPRFAKRISQEITAVFFVCVKWFLLKKMLVINTGVGYSPEILAPPVSHSHTPHFLSRNFLQRGGSEHEGKVGIATRQTADCSMALTWLGDIGCF